MALALRRPLLVTGEPGLGKTSLAYSIATCLGLGTPLRWEINSQTSLKDGLYAYDAVGHFHARGPDEADIGAFITLGPLGTALLPAALPRVLLVDELDKASYDLPHDLLHVFEEGSFIVPELVRAGGKRWVYPHDCRGREDRVSVESGRVVARQHPVVVITSNGEREFPAAFVRRCVRLELCRPSPERLAAIVRAQLGDVSDREIARALEAASGENTDVLLQTIFLAGQSGESLELFASALARSREPR